MRSMYSENKRVLSRRLGTGSRRLSLSEFQAAGPATAKSEMGMQQPIKYWATVNGCISVNTCIYSNQGIGKSPKSDLKSIKNSFLKVIRIKIKLPIKSFIRQA